MKYPKVLHVITDLLAHGAEKMLFKLLSGDPDASKTCMVVSMLDKGSIGEDIEALGIRVETLNLSRGIPSVSAIIKFSGIINEFDPDVIQAWMYHANILALLGSKVSRCSAPVVWNIRSSLHQYQQQKLLTRLTIKSGALLSGRVEKVIFNSQRSSVQHVKLGYRHSKVEVIPNGFDTEIFTPDSSVRSSVRRELNIPEDGFVVGLIGRDHPVKGHRYFLQAAKSFASRHADAYFLLAGKGIDTQNQRIWQESGGADHGLNILALGERRDIPRLISALDVLTSSSTSEAFPNVVGEAMSSAVVCVVTDVGDSAWVVGDTGIVVPPADPEALVSAWEQLLERGEPERKRLGLRARERVIKHFSLPGIVEAYRNLYRSLQK